jgi:hypothetical protein
LLAVGLNSKAGISPSNEEMKPIWKDILKIEEWRIRKSSQTCAKHFRGTDINGDKMKRLVPNEVPITSNYEEIIFLEEIIKISNDDTITGENLLALKTNIEMKLGSKLQEMGLDNGENKIVIFKLEMPTSR